jgi:hypothetical protein
MKSATGYYAGIRAITREEIAELIPLVFTPAWEKARAAREKARKAYAAWEKARAAWEKARAAWKNEAKILSGFIPDWWAINFIAADREDGVYCFVQSTTRNRKEVWFYDGKHYPDPDTVEVVCREE